MKITAHKLFDLHLDNWSSEIEDRYEYSDFKRNDRLAKGWISFDCILANADPNLVYCGITSFHTDIFRAYDRTAGAFVDLGYADIADPFDAKFHRSLVRSDDGAVYGAIALLHDVDSYYDAPGGAVVRYMPEGGTIEKIGIPVPHVYIQSMVIDEVRRIAYCQTFTPEYLAAFNLDSHESRILGLTGSGFAMGQGETIVLDKNGCVWGGWSVTRAWQNSAGIDQYRLFRYNPDHDRIEFFRHGLPHLDGSEGYAHLDGMICAADGMLYAGTSEGGLCRIDAETADVELLGAPCPPARIAAFAMGADGYLYGIGGRYGNASLFRLDIGTGVYELIGRLYDPELDVSAWQIHDMSIADGGIIFAGENDNPHRSSYLWEIEL